MSSQRITELRQFLHNVKMEGFPCTLHEVGQLEAELAALIRDELNPPAEAPAEAPAEETTDTPAEAPAEAPAEETADSQ